MCYHSFIIQKPKRKERKERNDQLIVVNILWEVNLMSPSWEITEQKGHMCVCSVAESCLTLCNSMDCSPPGSSVLGIFQARILEWVALLQGIFLTHRSHPYLLCLLHWQAGSGNHLAVHQKLTQHCKSTILPFLKRTWWNWIQQSTHLT